MSLIAIIVILAFVVGVIFSSFSSKEKANLSIEDKKLYVGDSLVVKLSDDKSKPILNATINIKLTDENGNHIEEQSTTNSKGKVKLRLDEKGKYSVDCEFDGNDRYAPENISTKINVKDAKTHVVSEDQNSATSSVENYPEYSSVFGSYRIVETHDEIALVETSAGEYYVFTGDGAYTYEGHDSRGIIEFGSLVSKSY